MDAGQPCLEICEDEMDDGQKPYSQTNTTPGGCMRQPDKHATNDLAVPPVQAQLARRRGFVGEARSGGFRCAGPVHSNKHAVLQLMRKLLKKYVFASERLVTNNLRTYSAAARELGIELPV